MTATRFCAWRSTSARPMSPSSSNDPAPTIRGGDARADPEDPLRVAHQLRLAGDRHPAQLEVVVAVLDQAADPGVALEVADLLAAAVGPERDPPVPHDVEERGQVGRAVRPTLATCTLTCSRQEVGDLVRRSS